jgi:hypothetical protein
MLTTTTTMIIMMMIMMVTIITTMTMFMMLLMSWKSFHTLPVFVRILHFSTSSLNIHSIFPYTKQLLLLSSLKPTPLLFLNPKQWNIPNPYIMYVLCVHLYRIAISAHLLLHRKYTCKSVELQKIRAQHKLQALRAWLSTKCSLTPHAAMSSKLLSLHFIQVTCFKNAK